MKVLIIGSGGREHAIAWKLRQSSVVKRIYCAPGNPGIAAFAQCLPIKLDDISSLAAFAQREQIDLTVVGPEYPLTLGIVERFNELGLTIFGPSSQAVRLESSKNFAKEIMIAAGVPTARYQVFKSAGELQNHLANCPIPVVLKADGLAAGKGVFVCMNRSEALSAIPAIFGELHSEQVVVEEFMEGVEASFIVATDGERVVPLATAHDYKRIYDNDQGPNTGGMGTVSPTPRLSTEQEGWVVEYIIRPVLSEMARRGTPFSGFLYAGLMINQKGEIRVVEFNARLGDPETQVIMRRMSSDLAQLLFDLATKSGPALATWSEEHAVCLVLAANNYPGKPVLGDEITGINLTESLPGLVVFHAGTSLDDKGILRTAGGRVLNVTATGGSSMEARSRAYRGADMIQFKGRQLRRDIGSR
jgi:phosphoribosylamine--glycine ligase